MKLLNPFLDGTLSPLLGSLITYKKETLRLEEHQCGIRWLTLQHSRLIKVLWERKPKEKGENECVLWKFLRADVIEDNPYLDRALEM